MDIVIAAAICFGLVGFGEIISYLTKGTIPSMAATFVLYIILIWSGMSKDFPEISGMNYIGEFVMLLTIVHIGSAVVPMQYVKNWRTVIVTLGALAGGLLMVLGVGGLIFGFDTMLAGAGAACGGGAIGAIVAINKLNEIGAVALAAIPAMILGVIDLYGQPICALILRKYDKKLSAEDAYLLNKMANKENDIVKISKRGVKLGTEENPCMFMPTIIPKEYEKEAVLIFEASAISALSYWLDALTGINMCMWGFVITIALCALGIVRLGIIERSRADGFVFTAYVVWLMSSLNTLTPQALLESIVPVIAILVLATVGLGLGGAIVGKLLKVDVFLSAACGVGLLFLCPGVMFVGDEVAKGVGRDEEETKFLKDTTMPHLYISANAGYVIAVGITVSILVPMIG